jgi:dUTP pyrophosphatase
VTSLRIAIKSLSALVSLPQYATPGSAGMDLPAAVESPVTVAPGTVEVIPCGFSIALPPGYEAQVRPRSGLAVKHSVTVLNTPGTIDPDYRGEVKAILINLGREPFVVTTGMRIAQLVVAPFTRVEWDAVEELSDTSRGAGGFGHTGR